MNQFDYQRAADATDAVRRSVAAPGTKYLGGGTNLVDLMREGIAAPRFLSTSAGSRGTSSRLKTEVF